MGVAFAKPQYWDCEWDTCASSLQIGSAFDFMSVQGGVFSDPSLDFYENKTAGCFFNIFDCSSAADTTSCVNDESNVVEVVTKGESYVVLTTSRGINAQKYYAMGLKLVTNDTSVNQIDSVGGTNVSGIDDWNYGGIYDTVDDLFDWDVPFSGDEVTAYSWRLICAAGPPIKRAYLSSIATYQLQDPLPPPACPDLFRVDGKRSRVGKWEGASPFANNNTASVLQPVLYVSVSGNASYNFTFSSNQCPSAAEPGTFPDFPILSAELDTGCGTSGDRTSKLYDLAIPFLDCGFQRVGSGAELSPGRYAKEKMVASFNARFTREVTFLGTPFQQEYSYFFGLSVQFESNFVLNNQYTNVAVVCSETSPEPCNTSSLVLASAAVAAAAAAASSEPARLRRQLVQEPARGAYRLTATFRDPLSALARNREEGFRRTFDFASCEDMAAVEQEFAYGTDRLVLRGDMRAECEAAIQDTIKSRPLVSDPQHLLPPPSSQQKPLSSPALDGPPDTWIFWTEELLIYGDQPLTVVSAACDGCLPPEDCASAREENTLAFLPRTYLNAEDDFMRVPNMFKVINTRPFCARDQPTINVTIIYRNEAQTSFEYNVSDALRPKSTRLALEIQRPGHDVLVAQQVLGSAEAAASTPIPSPMTTPTATNDPNAETASAKTGAAKSPLARFFLESFTGWMLLTFIGLLLVASCCGLALFYFAVARRRKSAANSTVEKEGGWRKKQHLPPKSLSLPASHDLELTTQVPVDSANTAPKP